MLNLTIAGNDLRSGFFLRAHHAIARDDFVTHIIPLPGRAYA
jgi:hypothetical protein